MQGTATIEGISIEESKNDSSVRPLETLRNGAFSKEIRLEVSPDEYEELVNFLADPKPAQFSDRAKEAIREELIRMEQTGRAKSVVNHSHIYLYLRA